MTKTEKTDVTPAGVPEGRARTPFLTEALILAAASGLSYFYAFMFEMGYLVHFSLPTTIITINIEKVFISFIFFTLFSIPAIITYELVAIVGKRLEFKMRAFATALLYAILVSVIYGLTADSLGIDKGNFIYLIPILIITMFFITVAYYSSQPAGNKGRDFLTFVGEKLKHGLIGPLIRHMGPEIFLLVLFAIMFLPVQTYRLGKSEAAKKETYLVSEQSVQWVLIRIYGPQAILAEYDPTTKTTSGKFKFVQLGADGAREFVLKEIGPLNSTK